MNQPTNVIAIEKLSGHRYVFFFDDLQALREQLWRFAGDVELDFTWYDAAYLYRRAVKAVLGFAWNGDSG